MFVRVCVRCDCVYEVTNLVAPLILRCIPFKEARFEESEVLPSMQITAYLQIRCEALCTCVRLQVCIVFSSISYTIYHTTGRAKNLVPLSTCMSLYEKDTSNQMQIHRQHFANV